MRRYDDIVADDDWLPIVEGDAWSVPGPVERHHALADEHLDLGPDDAARMLFANTAPEVVRGIRPGDFIVVAGTFAADADEPILPAALLALDVGGVVATTFGSRFLRQSLEIGLPPLVVAEAAAIRSGDRLRVDVEAHIVVNQSSGDRYVIRNLDDDEIGALRALRRNV